MLSEPRPSAELLRHAGAGVQAKRIRNTAEVNEHPAVGTIRALRAEIAFLKQQLSAATDGADALAASLQAGHVPGAGGGRATAHAQTAGRELSGGKVVEEEQSAVDRPLQGSMSRLRAGGCADSAARDGRGAGAGAAGGGVSDGDRALPDRRPVTREHVASVAQPRRPGADLAGRISDDGDAREIGEVSGIRPCSAGDAVSGSGAGVGGDAGVEAWVSGGLLGDVRPGRGEGTASGSGGGAEADAEGQNAVTRELVGKVVRYSEVTRALQQCHSRALKAHAALQRRYAEVVAARAAEGERLEGVERENVELRELGALLSSAVQVRSLPYTLFVQGAWRGGGGV